MKNILFIKFIFLFIAIGLSILSILAITGHFPNKLGNVVERVMKFDPFWTSLEYRKRLGIEIVKLSLKEEQELHSMIEEVLMAGFRYYDTGEEKEFEKVKDLFVEGEYENVRKKIERIHNQEKEYLDTHLYGCKTPAQLPEGKFSQLRKYKSLKNRIGIMSLFDITAPDFLYGGCLGDHFYLFIFRQMNSEWKIEKIGGVGLGCPVSEMTEEPVIEELLEAIKRGL